MSLIHTQSIRAGWSKACVEGYTAGVVIHELCDEVDSLRERIAALEARDAKMREALDPRNTETKFAYIGEFKFTSEVVDEEGNSCIKTHYVPWTTIKEIMAAIAKRAALLPATTSGDGGETK